MGNFYQWKKIVFWVSGIVESFSLRFPIPVRWWIPATPQSCTTISASTAPSLVSPKYIILVFILESQILTFGIDSFVLRTSLLSTSVLMTSFLVNLYLTFRACIIKLFMTMINGAPPRARVARATSGRCRKPPTIHENVQEADFSPHTFLCGLQHIMRASVLPGLYMTVKTSAFLSQLNLLGATWKHEFVVLELRWVHPFCNFRCRQYTFIKKLKHYFPQKLK
jgi:hypothetical protein